MAGGVSGLGLGFLGFWVQGLWVWLLGLGVQKIRSSCVSAPSLWMSIWRLSPKPETLNPKP